MAGIVYFSPKLTPEQIAQRNQERADKIVARQESSSNQQDDLDKNSSNANDNQKSESIQGEIENICKKNIAADDQLVEVKINEDMGNKYWGSGKNIVLIYFKSGSGFRGVELEKVANIMEGVYSTDLPISQVVVFSQDMSGHLIMKSTLSEERAAKIDWDHIRYSKFDKQLDEFWTIPELRQ